MITIILSFVCVPSYCGVVDPRKQDWCNDTLAWQTQHKHCFFIWYRYRNLNLRWSIQGCFHIGYTDICDTKNQDFQQNYDIWSSFFEFDFRWSPLKGCHQLSVFALCPYVQNMYNMWEGYDNVRAPEYTWSGLKRIIYIYFDNGFKMLENPCELSLSHRSCWKNQEWKFLDVPFLRMKSVHSVGHKMVICIYFVDGFKM